MPPLQPNVSAADAALFFRLMWTLQADVNRRLKLVPGVASAEAYARLGQEAKYEVRQALWAQPELLKAFVRENPARLPAAELQIVERWQRRLAGDFYIMRFLKRYTIFLSAKQDSPAYGVLGLRDRLQDVMAGAPPPILVQAVLLPFKGHIIYDGLLSPYAIAFGAGYRGDLNEIYQRAKQTGRIIETLEPELAAALPPLTKKPARDWRPVLDGLVATSDQLRQAGTAVETRAFGVLKASARLAQAAARAPDDVEELDRLRRRVFTALRQFETALEREAWS